MEKVISKEDLHKSGVYMILNTCDDKKYIGSTINFQGRFNQHLSSLKKNKHENKYLQRAFNKHGIEKFEFHVVEVCDAEQRLTLEQMYLDNIFSLSFSDRVSRYYNTNSKASCPPTMCGKDNPRFGVIVSAETRKKMSLARIGKFIGEENNFFGKRHSDQTRQKMKEAHKVKPITVKNIKTGETQTFRIIDDVVKYLQTSQRTILRRLNEAHYQNKTINDSWIVYREQGD